MNEKQILYDLFQAYYDCRKNKRNTLNQLDFEYNLELNIIKLQQEIITGTYEVGRSIYFIQNSPVKREVFAGDFRDRVVHHFVYNAISPIFDREFIYDSYSCRVGKGTSFGIKRVQKFIRSCTNNYTEDCYILKLDISGYFMSMNKNILWEKIEKVLKKSLQSSLINGTKTPPNLPLSGEGLNSPPDKGELEGVILSLIHKIISNNPTKNSIFKGKKSDYIGLPKNKSLFFAKDGCGLPIGNLTSQLFSNIYLSDFDKFVKYELKKPVPLSKGVAGKAGGLFYGRYVDDFIIVHTDKNYLTSLIPQISNYLQSKLGLTLHPNKIYMQHFKKGVLFLGAFIKPHRTYIRKRTIGNFYEKIQKLNNEVKNHPGNYKKPVLKSKFLSIINSYLGFLKHYKSYKVRKKLFLQKVHASFWNEFYISGGYSKVVRKKK